MTWLLTLWLITGTVSTAMQILFGLTVFLFQELITFFYDTNETSKRRKKEQAFQLFLPFYLERLEKQVNDNKGYLVNGKVMIYFLFNFASFVIFYYLKLNLINLNILRC